MFVLCLFLIQQQYGRSFIFYELFSVYEHFKQPQFMLLDNENNLNHILFHSVNNEMEIFFGRCARICIFKL